MERREVRRPTAAVGLMVLGGLVAGVGVFLPWARASAGPFGVSARGIDGSDGWIVLVACGALLLAALASWVASSRGARVGLGVLALLAGIVTAGLGAFDAASAEDSFVEGAAGELSEQLGIGAEEAEQGVREAIDAGELGIELQAGIFVVIAGGVLGLLGGLAGMASRVVAPVPAPGTVAPPAPAPQAPLLPTPPPPSARPPESGPTEGAAD